MKKISLSMMEFKDDFTVNSSIKDELVLKELLSSTITTYNHIVYAWNYIKKEGYDYDPRFYYQSIILNIWLLSSLTKRISFDVVKQNTALKDLRDNLAHMDEKLKNSLNFIDPDLLPRKKSNLESSIKVNGKDYPPNLIGLNIKGDKVCTPFGIIGSNIISTLQPNQKYSSDTYNKEGFIVYSIDKNAIEGITGKFRKLLGKFYKELKYIGT